ncbi:MAG: hydantoinase B/oxoprolinase family protein [Actinobacteria bacterium]|nr:hydantoinase B/oxoprolinase family protein [Actinomycetota bacterium]
MLDPIGLSVLQGALAGVAEEMGAVLIRASYSSNIKERRDCSAALFDVSGRLIAQAEHIPVHLGAMPESVAAVMDKQPEAGDVFILNDPYRGGTHLPDITLVSPIGLGERLLGFAVTRAHHSDVGGMTPGSMPSGSRELYQEGIVIPPVRIVAKQRPVDDVLDLILANVRTPEIREGDLRAQIAANRVGVTRLVEMARRYGAGDLLSAFDDVLDYAEAGARKVIAELPDGSYRAVEYMEGDGVVDDDIPIAVRVVIKGDELTIDFDGSAPAVAGNVNCPLAVTRSACYFALRVLMSSDVPRNSGAYRPLRIEAPEGSIVNALRPSAVVAGNVETSQRIADAVLLALGEAAQLPAQGQGTMNNLVIGGSGWTYYETIGGGQGASASGPGESGVHVGMSNTLNTPIEALELELPLRVESLQLRYGSGGAGRMRGGDGIERTVRVLTDARLSLLSDRRRHGPQGEESGGSGARGRNLVNGKPVSAKVDMELSEGDVVTVLTPGGGGFGSA